MAKSYSWTGDAAAIARYPSSTGATKLFLNADTGETTSMTGGSLANRVIDIEVDPVVVKVNQLAGNVTVEQPAGTVVATFTPTIIPPFGAI